MFQRKLLCQSSIQIFLSDEEHHFTISVLKNKFFKFNYIFLTFYLENVQIQRSEKGFTEHVFILCLDSNINTLLCLLCYMPSTLNKGVGNLLLEEPDVCCA